MEDIRGCGHDLHDRVASRLTTRMEDIRGRMEDIRGSKLMPCLPRLLDRTGLAPHAEGAQPLPGCVPARSTLGCRHSDGASAFSTLLLVVVLIVGAVLRFYGLDWDGGIGAHPDERYVVGVAEGLHWPDALNPFDVAPDLAYGHLPLYVLALAARLVGGVDPLLVGRALAALCDLGTVALTFALGRRVSREVDGLVAAACVAFTVLHVQQAHFATADAPVAFFVLGTLLWAVRLAEGGRLVDAWVAGAWAGLALGTKFSAALLALPLGAAVYVCSTESGEAGARWKRGLAIGAAAVLAFACTNPFALLSFPTFWRNVAEQGAIARGVLDVPYTRQFHGTWPYVYPVVQQLCWGMGLPLGLAAFGGLATGVWQAVRRPPRRSEWVLLAWVVPGFAFTGALYARYPRYVLPLTPVLAVYGARFLASLGRWCGRWSRVRSRVGPRMNSRPDTENALKRVAEGRAVAYYLLVGFVLTSTLLHCLAFVSIYRSPHPWLVASEWFAEQVVRGAVVAVEEWDHPLPLDGTGYDVRALPVFDEDTPEKWATMEAVLAEADYVVIASRRGYATLARWPERYPRMARYYRALFEGELGFEPVACFGRHPRLGPLAVVDDPAAGRGSESVGFSLPELCQPEAPAVLRLGRLDESFVVYDHPQVVILARYVKYYALPEPYSGGIIASHE